MNKRIYFILFPILALLFSSYSIGHNAIATPAKSFGTGITQNTAHDALPFSVGLRKENRSINKNAIRIKAWDGTFAINIPSQWQPSNTIEYFFVSYYEIYKEHVRDDHFCDYSLRGPPSVI